MISDKQLAANRTNAQKSTGPRTETGKSIASKNSITHGLRSAHPVIEDEDPAEFNDFRNDMITQFAPSGPMERLLIDRIVHAAWRLRRIGTIEVEVYDFLRHPAKKKSNKSQTARALRSSRYLQQHQNQARVATPGNRFSSFNEARDAWLQTEDGKLFSQNKWPSDPNYPSWIHSFQKFKEPRDLSGSEFVADSQITLDVIDRASAKTDAKEDLANLDQLAQIHQTPDTQPKDPPLPLGRAVVNDMQNNSLLTRLSRYETGIERSMFKNLRQLQYLQLQRVTRKASEPNGDHNPAF